MSDAARLLCHGGSGHRERARIGAWPDVGQGALGDLLGLPAGTGRFQFGCSVLAGRPALLYRERQNEDQRGGYAYTLLLDPGDAAWARFGWNAALLLHALRVRADGGLPAELRIEPERLSAEGLKTLVDSLPPPPVEPSTEAFASGAVAAWAGTAVGEERGPFSLGEPARSLSPEEVARSLAALPECFRPGQGWIVGAGSRNAEAFGCRLVLDPPGDGPGPPTPAAVESGRELLEAFAGLRWDDEMVAPFAGLARVPTLFWPERFAAARAELAERIVLAYRLGRTESLGEAAARRLGLVLRAGGHLSKDLSALAVRRLADGRAAGDPELNRLLVSAWLDRVVTLLPASTARFDPAAVRSVILERGIEPADARVSSLLDLSARADVWIAFARRERQRERIPELALRAARDVDAAAGTKASKTEALTRILETAFAQSLAHRGGISDWEALREDTVIGRWVKKKLRQGPSEGSAPAVGDPHWLVRNDVRTTLADAEEEAPEAFVTLLTEGDASFDDGRRATARSLAPEAAAREDVVSAFEELLAAPLAGDERGKALARRLASAPDAIEPLLAAAGEGTARRLVSLLAREQPEEFEAAARSLWRSTHENSRKGAPPPNPALTIALLEHLRTPDGAGLAHRIGAALYGDDPERVARLLPKLLGQIRSSMTPASGARNPARA